MKELKNRDNLDELVYYLNQEINSTLQSVDEYLDLKNPEHVANAYYPHPFYKVEKFLAHGGMGNVFVVEDLNIRRKVAVKVLRKKGDISHNQIRRFIQEARITGQLEHPNIVPVHQLAVTMDGTVFYVMKLIEGPTLKDILSLIAQNNKEIIQQYPLSKLLRIFLDAANAVAFAHSKKIIHRDLKPENIIAGDFGQTFVLDWGLAKFIYNPDLDTPSDYPSEGEFINSNQYTQVGTVMGTPPYMAPEQLRGDTYRVDHRTDIYALGCILYSILTLQVPFAKQEGKELFRAKHEGDILPPDYLVIEQNLRLPHIPGNRVPPALAAVCMKAIAPLPEERYQSVEELQQDIESYLAGFFTQAEDPDIFRALALFVKRHQRECALVGGFLVFLLVFLLFFLRGQFQYQTQLREMNQKLQQVNYRLMTLSKRAVPMFLEKGINLIDQDKWEEAFQFFYLASRSEHDVPLVAIHLLRCCLVLDKWQEAKEIWQSIQEKRKDPIVDEWCRRLAELIEAIKAKESTSLAKLSFKELIEFAELAYKNRDISLTKAFYIKATLQALQEQKLLLALESTFAHIQVIHSQNIGKIHYTYQVHPNGTLDLQILGNPGLRYLHPLIYLPITSLEVTQCPQLTDISFVTRLPLVSLNISQCGIHELPELSNSIKKLNLSYTPIQSLRALEKLSYLEYLNISWCRNLPSSTFRHLRNLPIKTLIANYTKMIDNLDWITSLVFLEHLELENTDVADFQPLQHLSKLTYLNVSNTSIQNIFFLQKLPLVSFIAAFTPIADISGLTNNSLQYLDLRGTNIEDLIPFTKLKLHQLYLNHCTKIRSLLPLKECTSLTHLTIPSQADHILILKNLSNLKYLGYEFPPDPVDKFWEQYPQLRNP